MRGRVRTRRNWVRGFDWDGFDIRNAVGADGTWGEWIRVPSDSVDPLDGLFRPPKTLTRLLLYPFFYVEGLSAPPAYATAYIGIRAWSVNSLSISSDFPDPYNAADDWIAYLVMPIVRVTSAASQDWYSTWMFGTERGCIDIKSQRKLPPGVGISLSVGFEGPTGASLYTNFIARVGLKGDVTAPGLGGS